MIMIPRWTHVHFDRFQLTFANLQISPDANQWIPPDLHDMGWSTWHGVVAIRIQQEVLWIPHEPSWGPIDSRRAQTVFIASLVSPSAMWWIPDEPAWNQIYPTLAQMDFYGSQRGMDHQWTQVSLGGSHIYEPICRTLWVGDEPMLRIVPR